MAKNAKDYLKHIADNVVKHGTIGLTDLSEKSREHLDEHEIWDHRDLADVAFGASNTIENIHSAVNELSDKDIVKMQPEITRCLVGAINDIATTVSCNASSIRDTADFIGDVFYREDNVPAEDILDHYRDKFVMAKEEGVTPFDIKQ